MHAPPMPFRRHCTVTAPNPKRVPVRKAARLAVCSLLTVLFSAGWQRQAVAEDLALQDAAAMAGVAMFLNARAPGLILAPDDG